MKSVSRDLYVADCVPGQEKLGENLSVNVDKLFLSYSFHSKQHAVVGTIHKVERIYIDIPFPYISIDIFTGILYKNKVDGDLFTGSSEGCGLQATQNNSQS